MLQNRPRFQVRCYKTTKQLEKAIKKAVEAVEKEGEKQVDILYHAAAIALYRYHGWKQLRIERFVEVSNDTYTECGSSENLSMIEMLYDETGIELMRSDGLQSWRDVSYLTSEIADKPLDSYQWLAMWQNKYKWVASQITASILLALHRKEGWGVDRCGRFFQELEDVKHEYDCDPKRLKEQSEKETGFVIKEGFELMDEVES